MRVRDTVHSYGINKTTSNVRPLEVVKSDMKTWENAVDAWKERVEDYNSGWDDDSGDSAKAVRLEQGLKQAEDNYAKLKAEYESHPDYYAEKYAGKSGFEKATTGIIGSAIATVPVVAETAAAAWQEAERKSGSEEYQSALRAEKTAWNKMNAYADSYFGSFDMIDQKGAPGKAARLFWGEDEQQNE